MKLPKDAETWPRVTEIIGAVIPSPGLERMKQMEPARLQFLADRGSRFHEITSWIDQAWAKGWNGAWTWAGISPKIHGALANRPDMGELLRLYCEWFDENVTEVIASERPVCHSLYRYRGTCDLIVKLKGQKIPWVIDKKVRASLSPEIGLQVAAYGEAARDMGIIKTPYRRAALQFKVKEDKVTRKFQEYSDAADAGTFFACVAVHQFLHGNKSREANHDDI